MKIMYVLLCVCFVQMGCGSSSVISSFDEFNADAEGSGATIVFKDGRALDVHNVLALPDSTHFWYDQANALIVVPTSTIRYLVLTNRLVGFLEGAGFGVAGGCVAILVMGGGTSQEHGFGAGADVFSMLLLGAAAGGVIGGIPGMIIGHSHEYHVVVNADTTK